MRLLPLLLNTFLLQVHLQIWSKREENTEKGIEKPMEELFGQLGKEGRKKKEKRNLKSPPIAALVEGKNRNQKKIKKKEKRRERRKGKLSPEYQFSSKERKEIEEKKKRKEKKREGK